MPSNLRLSVFAKQSIVLNTVHNIYMLVLYNHLLQYQ
jgi:hypothetical protein